MTRSSTIKFVEDKVSQYLSLSSATREFKVSAKALRKLTGDGGEFPVCEWAGTLFYELSELERRFCWRKSRAQRAREISYLLLNFQSATRH